MGNASVTMLNHWLSEYWWILASLAYVIALVIVIVIFTRRGTIATTWPKIVLGINCALILLIPAMHLPMSFIGAVLVVISLLLLFRSFLVR